MRRCRRLAARRARSGAGPRDPASRRAAGGRGAGDRQLNGSSKGRKTEIYSIGYDLDALDGGANICETWDLDDERPSISAYEALRQIATDDTYFYNKPDPGQLNSIYTKIAVKVLGTKLVE
jgi:hypothetical protein